eukprot:9883595-Ditylum_brightwellii.AAC.1
MLWSGEKGNNVGIGAYAYVLVYMRDGKTCVPWPRNPLAFVLSNGDGIFQKKQDGVFSFGMG